MDTRNFRITTIGDYNLTGKTFGKGNYSCVKEAIHKETNKTYALKIIDLVDAKDNYIKRHYKREGYLLSKIKHPNIITMFDCLQCKTHFVLVLEIIPENLCDFVRNQKVGRLEESFGRLLFRQMVSAISHLHKIGIIHRDVKLENILIDTKRNTIKLADFGLSNEWNKETLLMTNCGSPEYSAPELHSNSPYGNEVDVWALGVVLFAMVVGRLPFDVEKKKPVSNQQRRELFLEETKRGLKTLKHQNYMATTSHHFRNLTSRMLNPEQHNRIKMIEVEKHQWVMFPQTMKIEPAKNPFNTNRLQSTAASNYSVTGIRPGTVNCNPVSTSQRQQRAITRADQHRNLSTTGIRWR